MTQSSALSRTCIWDVLEVFEVPGSDDLGIVHFHMAGTLGGVPVERNDVAGPSRLEGRQGEVVGVYYRTEHEALQAAGLRG